MPQVIPAIIVGISAGVAVGGAAAVWIGVAAGVGTLALQNAMKPEMPSVEENVGAAQNLTTAPLQSRRGVYGDTVVSGSIVGYARKKINDKDTHVLAVTLAGHIIESAELYEINGKEPHEGCQAIIFDGTQTTASPDLIDHVEDWTEDHIGFGVAYAVVYVPVDPEKMSGGLNNVTFKVKGSKVYDPRKDTTVGGAGSHRSNDPTTWEWSDNVILCAFDYVRFKGFKKLNLDKFDIGHVIEHATICDELVDYEDSDGVTHQEKRFTANGTWMYDESPPSVLQRILSACGGKPYRRGGKIYLHTASYHGMATLTLTENDAAGDIKIIPHREIRDRVNLVRASFVDPRKGWQPTDAPVVKNATYLQKDGMELENDLQLSFTTSSSMAQRLMKYHLERNRAGMRIEFPAKAKALSALAGRTVRIQFPDDGIDKEFIVAEWDFDLKSKVTRLMLEEESPLLYSDDVTPNVGDITPNTSLPDFNVPAPPENVQFTSDLAATHRQGYLSWSHPLPQAVTHYRVRISRDGSVVSEFSVIASDMPRQDVAGLDSGTYTITVEAKNRFERYSEPALIELTLVEPVPPTELAVTVSDWQIQVRPILPGVGVRTLFEFDIVVGDGEGYTPTVQARGMSHIYSGLDPSTLHTVFVRTVNDFGRSEWISEAATTSAAGTQVDGFLQPIREELDAIDTLLGGAWNPTQTVAELFTQVFRDQELQETGRATLVIARKAGKDVEGALFAIDAIQGDVYNESTGLAASFALAQQASADADGNAESITAILSGVTGTNNYADALLTLQAYFTEGGLGARAFLGVDVGGRITGIVINDNGATQQIEFKAGSFAFLNSSNTPVVFWDANKGRYVFDGTLVSVDAELGGWLLDETALASGGAGEQRVIIDSNGNYVRFFNAADEMVGEMSPQRFILGSVNGPYMEWTPAGLTVNGDIYSQNGSMGGWYITQNMLRSAQSGARIELNAEKNRISVFDAVNEKVVMGYLQGLPKNDGSGNWEAGVYGIFIRAGDQLRIDGDVNYTSGDWLVANDASVKIFNSDYEIVRLGTNDGKKGVFIFDGSAMANVIGEFSSARIKVGVGDNSLEYINGVLTVSGTIIADDGTIANWEVLPGMLRSASSGKRIEIDANNTRINAYDVSNTNVMSLSPDVMRFGNTSGTYIQWTPATGLEVVGKVTATEGSFSNWRIRQDFIESVSYSEGSTNYRAVLFAGDGTNEPYLSFYEPGNILRASLSPSRLFAGDVNSDYIEWTPVGGLVIRGEVLADRGVIGGWEATSDLLRSAASGTRVQLDSTKNRISIFDAVDEKVVMGYLGGLPKNDGSGTWSSTNYGFYVRAGDKLTIDGDVNYTDGDWLIDGDASVKIRNGQGREIIRLGTVAGIKGLFLFDGSTTEGTTKLGEFSNQRIQVGTGSQKLTYEGGNLSITGTVNALDGNFNGTLTSISGELGGWRLNDGYIQSVTYTEGQTNPRAVLYSGGVGATPYLTFYDIGNVMRASISSTRLFAGNLSGQHIEWTPQNGLTVRGHVEAISGSFSGAIEGGTIDIGNGSFVVDVDGNITQQNGYYRTAESTSSDVRVLIDGRPSSPYAIFIGVGGASDANAIFAIKKDGTRIIDPDWIRDVVGTTSESQFAASTGNNSNPVTATVTHASAGNAVDATGTVSMNVVMDGDYRDSNYSLTAIIKRDGTTIASQTVNFSQTYFNNEPGLTETGFQAAITLETRDNGAAAGNRQYQVTFTRTIVGTIKLASSRVTVKTNEKLV
ncbi:phage tail protein [Pseudidiomarina aestuarii]|uniref:phage tail protein n=1 Tax=Pseudidiomarina aestuarii TaxID=624146 RepID=UPI003A9809DE